MARKLVSWYEAFLHYTSDFQAPVIFKRWTAFAIIAGALERKVWLKDVSAGHITYPNLYCFLVAPPASGKTNLTALAYRLWKSIPKHHVAPQQVTRASLMDMLVKSERVILRPKDTPSTVEFNSLKVCINELGVFMPVYDNDFISFLTDVFDNQPTAEMKRGREIDTYIESPQINLFAGCTPSFLQFTLPESAWDQGFMSRVIPVYNGEISQPALFLDVPDRTKEYEALVTDLKHIGELYGKMTFTPAAVRGILEWVKGGQQPVPDHPKLTHYCGRRVYQLLKLCMIAAVMERDDLIIDLPHFDLAKRLLLEAEAAMPDIFHSMSIGGDAGAVKLAAHFIFKMYMKTREPIREQVVVAYLMEQVPSHSVARILDLMVRGGIIEKDNLNKLGPVYKPIRHTLQ